MLCVSAILPAFAHSAERGPFEPVAKNPDGEQHYMKRQDSRIFQSAKNGNLAALEEALANRETSGERIGPEEDVMTPLMAAAAGGHHKCVAFLLRKGAHPRRFVLTLIQGQPCSNHRSLYRRRHGYLHRGPYLSAFDLCTQAELSESEPHQKCAALIAIAEKKHMPEKFEKPAEETP